MKITVNKEATNQRIEEAFEEAIEAIKANASGGRDTTELYIDKDISTAVKKRLLKGVGDIQFLVVRQGINPFTGRTEHYTAEILGDQKYYKVRIQN